MYRDALAVFNKIAQELPADELEKVSKQVLATIVSEGEKIEKQAFLVKKIKAARQDALLKRLDNLKKSAIKAKRDLVSSRRKINTLKQENELLRKGNKMWKGVGAVGTGIGLMGTGYGMVKDHENRKLKGYYY